ncbi:MAG: methionine adenosyltransferase [Chloroflexi bacterium]|jgi:S-adenosylmethionine synthetase|nr:methionine adenosyltransferase [Chloroflexota bacterium]MBT5319642.1 methionine adenosyltransferase [Chloroflexota bacterium]
MAPSTYLVTSESVTEGHPDKLCDQVSDGVLDAIFAQDPQARVACETACTTGVMFVFGEITTTAYVDIAAVAREVIRDVGYTSSDYGFDAESAGVMVSIKEQSPDIKGGVDTALEVRGEEGAAEVGAGDQGMMIGYAVRETPELMPLPIALAHRITRAMAKERKNGNLPYLRPDGKSQVTIEYNEDNSVKRVHTILMSTQHDPAVSQETIERDLKILANHEIPEGLVDDDTLFFVNPSGRFVLGGPAADAGLTGRKIIVDTYGGSARHGGGAFSGKDPTKVDRSAAYAARWVAKNIVGAELADRAEVQVSYAIGVAQPISISVETYGTGKVDNARIVELIEEHFDLRPQAIIDTLDLRRPIFRQTAAYGHFGRDDLNLPWERLDKVDALKAAIA